jgi:hypothetical protein
MAINYTWSIRNCDVYPSKNSKSNVVWNVNWRLTGKDDANNDSDGNPQTADVSGNQVLDTSDLSSFINWSDLKESDVAGWVESALTSDQLARHKADINGKIAEKISPKSVTKTLS